jgi:hypothetical protein
MTHGGATAGEIISEVLLIAVPDELWLHPGYCLHHGHLK